MSLRGGRRPTWQSREDSYVFADGFPAIRPGPARFPRRIAPRNDKPGGIARSAKPLCNLPACKALTERRYSQTWRRIRSAMPFPFRQCLPEIATAPLGPRNDKLEGLAPQNACRKDCQPARRSLSAATFFSRPAGLCRERRYRRNWFVRFYRQPVRTATACTRLPRRLRLLAMTSLWFSPF